jgi:hypothetical protein
LVDKIGQDVLKYRRRRARSGLIPDETRRIPRKCRKRYVLKTNPEKVKIAMSWLKVHKDEILKEAVKRTGKATASTIATVVFPQIAPIIWGTTALDEPAKMFVITLVKQIFNIT